MTGAPEASAEPCGYALTNGKTKHSEYLYVSFPVAGKVYHKAVLIVHLAACLQLSVQRCSYCIFQTSKV